MGLITVYSIYIAVALLLAIGVITAIVISVAVSRRWSRLLLPMIITLLLAGGAAGVLVSGRDLSHAGLSIVISIFESRGGAVWVNRSFIGLIVALCLGALVGKLISREHFPIQGRSLFFGFLLYYITLSFLPSVFGTEPAFLHNELYPLLVMIGVFLSERPTPEQFHTFSKWLLFSFVAASLLAAVGLPDLAIQPDYHGWIPGFDYRLWGLASHANLLATPALTLLLLEYLQPTRNRLLQILLILCALSTLVLSQSKTTWVAALFAMSYLVAYRKVPELGRALRGNGPIPLSSVFYLGSILLALLALATALVVVDTDRLIDGIMASEIGEGLETASGRDLIWATALQEWGNNWLFGYGPLVWGDLYRFQHGMFSYAFHAHNQVLQTVSMGGGFALFGLLVYVWLLLRYAIRAAAATKGVSVAMLLIVLLRSVSEVPLPQHAVFSTDVLLHILLFMILVLNARQANQPQTSMDMKAPHQALHVGSSPSR